MRRAAGWILALLAGCTLAVELPDGRIRCQGPSDCPSNWLCHTEHPGEEGLCYRAGHEPDGAGVTLLPDAGSTDADTGSTDAEAGRTDADASSIRAEARDADADGSASTMHARDADTDAGVSAGPPDAGSDSGSIAMTPDASATTQDAGINHAPILAGLSLSKRRVVQGTADIACTCFATDEDGDALQYEWTAAGGSFADSAAKSTTYTASTVGLLDLTCQAKDGGGKAASDSASLRVYPEGIVTMLPFSRDSTDASGNGNGATLNGAVYGTDANGNSGSALEFDGVNNNVTLDNARVYYGLPGVTFVATLSIAPANHMRTIFTKGTSGYGLLSFLLTSDDDATSPRSFVVAQDNLLMKPTPSTAVTVTGYTPPLNKYIHVALSRANSGLVRVYVDGNVVYSGSVPQYADPNTSAVMLGNGPLGAYAGLIDEVQFYDHALSASEVQALVPLR